MDYLVESKYKEGAMDLNNMTFEDLEMYKSQLDQVRQRIIHLQNARSPLFKIPTELRNMIFLLATYGELQERKKSPRHAAMFKQPAFFATNRQIKAECTGLWFADVLIWEEFHSASKGWARMSTDEVRTMCLAKTAAGRCNLVTQSAFCDVVRTRDAVESSRSICPRKGLVRIDTEVPVPQLRWWVW